MQDVVQNRLKEIGGSKQFYWNNEKKKPDFWAKDVPFRKIWKEGDSNDEKKRSNLTKILEAIYTFHGYEPNTWVQESSQVILS